MFFKKRVDPAADQRAPREQLPSVLDALRGRTREAKLPQHVQDVLAAEFAKLEQTDPALGEYSLGLNYIEMVLALPWTRSSQCKLDLARAQAVLEARHHGLSRVKQRIYEFLAAKTLCSKARQTILIVDDEIAQRQHEACSSRRDIPATTPAIPRRSDGGDGLEIDLYYDLEDERSGQGLELLEDNRTALEVLQIMVTVRYGHAWKRWMLKQGAPIIRAVAGEPGRTARTVRRCWRRNCSQQMGGPDPCFDRPWATARTCKGGHCLIFLQCRFQLSVSVRLGLRG